MSGSPTDCQKYAAGFYAGYLTHAIGSMFVGGPITKGVSKASDAASKVKTVASSVKNSRIASNVGTTTRVVGDQIARRVDYNSIVRSIIE